MREAVIGTKTINCELFHSKDEFFIYSSGYMRRCDTDDIRDAFLNGDYELVSTFDRSSSSLEDELEGIFQKSQNLEHSWRGKDACRSTCVGDVVRVGKDYWIVAGTGFNFGWSEL